MVEILLTALSGLLILVGIVSIFIPALPDMLLIWLAGLGYGLSVGWGRSGPWLFGLMTGLGALGVAAELLGSGVGAKLRGAAIWSVLAGLGTGIMGLVFLGPLGGIGGLLLGAFLAEYGRQKDLRKAWGAMLGLGLGYGASLGLKLILGLAMALAWLVWVVGG